MERHVRFWRSLQEEEKKETGNAQAQVSADEVLEKNGINAMLESDLDERSLTQKAMSEVMRVLQERPTLIEELRVYRKYVPAIVKYCRGIDKLNEQLLTHFERYENGAIDKKYQRWTEEEDNALIELVCAEDMGILELSTTMGRTPSSIKTRISKLVGIRRLSKEVAGRFIGNIDGEYTECQIDGIVTKNAV